MAKYRTYKNGIYGIRYKGYYIIKDENKNFTVLDNTKKEVSSGYKSNKECEWYIDKLMASEGDLDIIKDLYSMEIYKLSGYMMQLIEKKDRDNLTDKETSILPWIEKIRKRKAEEKEF